MPSVGSNSYRAAFDAQFLVQKEAIKKTGQAQSSNDFQTSLRRDMKTAAKANTLTAADILALEHWNKFQRVQVGLNTYGRTWGHDEDIYISNTVFEINTRLEVKDNRFISSKNRPSCRLF